jgi:DUF4097 and DUF4098 domain-containing protein YvlB
MIARGIKSVLSTPACRLFLAGLAAALLLPMGTLLAADNGTRVEKSFPAEPNARIRILNPWGGTITVRGWDRAQVHAVYSTSSPKAEIDVDQTPATGEAEKIHFATRALDSQAATQEKAATYELDVPAGSSVEIHNPQGSVTVEKIGGDEDIESVNGKVAVNDASGHVFINTVNGDIDFARPSGRVEVTTVTGNLHFIASTSPKIRAQTQTGRIDFDGEFVPTGEYVMKTWRGDMDIVCSQSDSFELNARSINSRVDNQFHLNHKGHTTAPPGEAFGDQGQGDATVNLKSYSGTIHVRPRPN